uniref:Replication factor C large subunit n=1 Tax=Lygus hesperus TaxID=30085 RepID=A0A0A9VUD6_LYGHE
MYENRQLPKHVIKQIVEQANGDVSAAVVDLQSCAEGACEPRALHTRDTSKAIFRIIQRILNLKTDVDVESMVQPSNIPARTLVDTLFINYTRSVETFGSMVQVIEILSTVDTYLCRAERVFSDESVSSGIVVFAAHEFMNVRAEELAPGYLN